MKELKLENSNRVTLVDDADYENLKNTKWYLIQRPNQSDYVVDNTGKSIHVHIMGTFSRLTIDHKDRDGLNNQKYNLRYATQSQQCCNKSKAKGNYSSKAKGISWSKEQGKWIARIMINRKSKFLGYFSDHELAVDAYNFAAQKYHGEFARLNPQ